jgi:YVTN family beta-propeller protein
VGLAVLAGALMLRASQASTAHQFAYVANAATDTISVIDTATQSIVRTMPVGNGLRPQSVALSADGRSAYVSNLTGTISIIDTATNAVRTNISVGAPGALVASSDGRFVYATNGDLGIAVIDVTKQLFTAAISVTADSLALSPDGGALYALERNGTVISNFVILDTATATVTARIPLPQAPAAVAFALRPDGRQALVLLACSCNDFGSTCHSAVAVIDTLAATLSATVDLGSSNESGAAGPSSIAFAPDGTAAYITSGCGAYLPPLLSVLDTTTQEITGTVSLGEVPDALAVSPDGATVYVTEDSGLRLEAIATATSTLRGAASLQHPGLLVGGGPGIAVTPDNTKVYVAANAELYVINTADLQVIATLSASGPWDLALSHDGAALYVVNGTSGTLAVVDTVAHAVTATVPVETLPNAVAAAPDDSAVFVLNECATGQNCNCQNCKSNPTISVIDALTNTVTNTIVLVGWAEDIAVSPNGRLLHVLGCADTSCVQNSLLMLDVPSGTVEATVPIPGVPWRISLSSDGTLAYVASLFPGTVSVVDVASKMVRHTIPVAAEPEGLALAPDGAALYLAERSVFRSGPWSPPAGLVSAIQLPSGTSSLSVPIDGWPWAIDVTQDGAFAYAVTLDTISVIDLGAHRVSAVIPAGGSAIVMGPAPAPQTESSSGAGCTLGLPRHATLGSRETALLLVGAMLLWRRRRSKKRFSLVTTVSAIVLSTRINIGDG